MKRIIAIAVVFSFNAFAGMTTGNVQNDLENALNQSSAAMVKATDNEENIIIASQKGNSMFKSLKNRVDDNRELSSSGIAGVAAMSNIPALSGNKDFSFGMGVGHFDNESAISAGFQGRVSENFVTKVSFASAQSGDVVLGAGAAFEF
ncbi:YadA C-terminal domain-containing protein [Enterobacter hormaechei]